MKKNNLILLVCTILLTLGIIEGLLRLTGTKPGEINHLGNLQQQDSIIVYRNFATDEAGIYKFSPWVTDSLLKYFDCKSRKITNPEVDRVLFDGDKVQYIYESFCKQTGEPDFSLYWFLVEHVKGAEADTNCLKQAYERLDKNGSYTDTSWKQLFTEYFYRPFNTEGFRSIAFRNCTSRQLKVLVIGDSFVYGMDAHPQQNSFVDLLLTKGYIVYAAGIPGTDPAQYAAIANKYIPIIEPDVVVSCFYTGNDYMRYKREPNTNEPHEHLTNAGFYSSGPYGKYLNANEAYQFYKTIGTFPDSTNRLFDRICSFSSIGTLLWNTLYNKGLISHIAQNFYAAEKSITPENMYAITKIYTDRMTAICTADSVPHIQIVIPDIDANPLDTVPLKYLFGNRYNIPRNLDGKKDFFSKGIHLNNEGSVKYAAFIDSLLQPYKTAKLLSLTAKNKDERKEE
jgi:hypothetical protein